MRPPIPPPAPTPPLPRHGGDLGQAARLFPDAPGPWCDLSTGINPWPYRVPELDPTVWTRLPDAQALDGLLDAARAAYGVADAADVVAGPGSEILLVQLPRLFRPCDVAIVGPTYGDHALAWDAAGHRVRQVADPGEAMGATPFPVVVLCQPNNPDGQAWGADTVRELAIRCDRLGGVLVVDEAFADAHPDLSVAALAGMPGLVVLRSFGKFYGLAGLRLGFALGQAVLMRRLAAALGSWAVSGPALAVGAAALRDEVWRGAMRARLSAAAAALDGVLSQGGLTVVGGTALFRLAAAGDGDGVGLWRRLAAAGLWVRPFAYNPAWLRFGLPGDEGVTARLCAALERRP